MDEEIIHNPRYKQFQTAASALILRCLSPWVRFVSGPGEAVFLHEKYDAKQSDKNCMDKILTQPFRATRRQGY